MDFDYKVLIFEKNDHEHTPKQIEYLKSHKEIPPDEFVEQLDFLWDGHEDNITLTGERFVVEFIVGEKKGTFSLTVNDLNISIFIRSPYGEDQQILRMFNNKAFIMGFYHHLRTKSKDRVRFQTLFGPMRDLTNSYFEE